MNVLVTGGAGYIGSITNRFLQEAGLKTVVLDNLSEGHKEVIGPAKLIEADLRDKEKISSVFKEDKFDAVVHFAAKALAGESMEKPYEYFQNNIDGGLNLLEGMRQGGCKNIIFSSTCAIFGFPKTLPMDEKGEQNPVSVYGESKRIFEQILGWYDKIYTIKHISLRYFNAAGALEDGSLGENHTNETHIIPIAIQSALSASTFSLFGQDYQTPDGTCLRDYIHVLDLANAHILALKRLMETKQSDSYNLGTEKPYSNKEVIDMVKKVSGVDFPVVNASRRVGDPDAIYADSSKAKKELGWKPKYDNLEIIVKTAWAWHKTHPHGY